MVGLKLGIREITVKAHRGKVMQKMKADSVDDLVKIAVRLGLAPARNPRHFSREPCLQFILANSNQWTSGMQLCDAVVT